jgi:hypothetical protein
VQGLELKDTPQHRAVLQAAKPASLVVPNQPTFTPRLQIILKQERIA